MTPTARTLAFLRKRGLRSDVVERWIPHINQRKDLFGIIDIYKSRISPILEYGKKLRAVREVIQRLSIQASILLSGMWRNWSRRADQEGISNRQCSVWILREADLSQAIHAGKNEGRALFTGVLFTAPEDQADRQREFQLSQCWGAKLRGVRKEVSLLQCKPTVLRSIMWTEPLPKRIPCQFETRNRGGETMRLRASVAGLHCVFKRQITRTVRRNSLQPEPRFVGIGENDQSDESTAPKEGMRRSGVSYVPRVTCFEKADVVLRGKTWLVYSGGSK